MSKSVEALGRKFTAYQADLTNRDSLSTFLEQLKSENSRIDILINNAGMILRKPAAEHSDEYWDKVLSLNLNAPLY